MQRAVRRTTRSGELEGSPLPQRIKEISDNGCGPLYRPQRGVLFGSGMQRRLRHPAPPDLPLKAQGVFRMASSRFNQLGTAL